MMLITGFSKWIYIVNLDSARVCSGCFPKFIVMLEINLIIEDSSHAEEFTWDYLVIIACRTTACTAITDFPSVYCRI